LLCCGEKSTRIYLFYSSQQRATWKKCHFFVLKDENYKNIFEREQSNQPSVSELDVQTNKRNVSYSFQ
jgi:hypothetical protein